MNLAVNARDAMPRGGKLVIETKDVEITERNPQHTFLKVGSYVLLQVADNGCGMSKEVQAHIFEPFFSTKEPEKGTGLGLCTAYAIVKQSDGYLLVDSEIGRGTTFSIYLPHVEGSPELPAPAVEFASIPSGTETVQMVEDEDSLRTLVQGRLEKHGYTVLSASNGQEALNRAQRHHGTVHLLLTDVIMRANLPIA